MCGMVGLCRVGGRTTEADRESVRRMNAAVLHRGPDETVHYDDECSSLGFQRLSLLAPADGRQPFVHREGEVVLMVNGEVYNHRELEERLRGRHTFATSSDCEVLLHGYLDEGLAFLERVRGMYSFALLDNRRRELVMGRDRFGIKPLYYHRDEQRVVFGSEIKSLFHEGRTPRRLDWHGALRDPALNLDLTLVSGRVNTWFEDIHVVPAAHTVTIDLDTGEETVRRYWDVDVAADLSDASEEEIVVAYRDLLESSVRDCLTADCEVGLLLSGGIDSAAVAAFSQGSGIHTFTALTGSTVVNGDAEYSHRTAAFAGLPNHQILFDTERVPSGDEWRALLWLLETPQASPEHFYKYQLHRFARATRPRLKAMMLGQASDEFNGGYSKKLSAGGGWAGFLSTLDDMARATYLREHPQLRPWYDPRHGDLLTPAVSGDVYRQFVRWKTHDIEQYNTWHEDRTAAGNSIEARVPFLDHRIVELTNGVPVEMRESLFWDKAILRRGLESVLPPDIVARPKVSFYYDDRGYNNQRAFVRMLCVDRRALLEDALSAPGAKELVDRDALWGVVTALQSDPSLASLEYVLAVVNLGLLENLVAELPSVSFDPHRVEVEEELVVDVWEESEAAIAERVFEAAPVGPATRMRLVGGLRFLSDSSAPDVRLLAVDGVVAYTFDDEESALWVDVLQSFRAETSADEVAGALGADPVRVLEMATTAHGEGLLEVSGQ